MRNSLGLIISLFATLSAGQVAQAGVFISTSFRGTPWGSVSPGARTMPGWGAGVPVLNSTSGPILSVDFAGTAAGGEPYGIYGALGQRWTSSQSNGFYDTPSPGPLNVFNTESSLSFDSHFVGAEGVDRIFIIAPTEGLVTFPGLNPIAGTPEVGYGHGQFPGTLTTTGFLRGRFDLPPSAQLTQVPLAYFTQAGGITLFGKAITTQGEFEFGYGIGWPSLPEPSFSISFIILLYFRRSRPDHGHW